MGLSLFFSLFLSAVGMGQYRFDTWTTDNGLPQNGVRAITQSSEGYLWFTTFDGLVRFDGVRFTAFNKSNTPGIINNRFTGLYGDDVDRTLYATTMEDGVLTILQNGAFSSLSSDHVPGHYIDRITRGPDGEMRFLCVDEDRLSKSWYHLTGGKFEFIEKEDAETLDVSYKGRDGTEWVVSPIGATAKRGDRSVFIPLDMSAANFRPSLFEDRDGSLWIGENHIHHIEEDGKVRSYGLIDSLPENTIYHSGWQEVDGSVWFASGGGSSTGVGLIQFKDGKPHIWGRNDGFENRYIQSVFHDREGSVWLATDRGLSRRRNEVIQGYSTRDGLDHTEIYPLYRDHMGVIWSGSSKGLSTYRDGKFEAVKVTTKPGGLGEPWRQGAMSVQALWEDANGKMWIGLDGGIFLLKDGVGENFFQGGHISAIKSDRSGNVWVAASNGLFCFRDYKLTARYSVVDGLPNEFMTFIFEDSKGTLWFGGFGGLTKFEDGEFKNYTVLDGLAGNYVRTIHEDADGTLWIGTYDEGMSRFRNGEFVNIRRENGLYNNGVFAIEEDAAGFFWISSNHGIYRVKRQELNDFAAGKVTKIHSVGYGKEDGMLSTECNGGRQPASLRDLDGKIWFPTQNGIAVVDPTSESENSIPPTVVIEEVLVERQPVDFQGGVTVEPGLKDLEIRYTGISLIKSDQITFMYKLEGHDTEWVDAGTRRTANYSYLPPGKYTFRVRARNSDGVMNEQSAAVALDLQPFFYQTGLFFMIVMLIAAVGLLVVWKFSVYQLKRSERRLARLVTARTEELADANKVLQDLANSDGLTKIGNRRRFASFLTDEWHRAVRFRTQISLVLLDIDHFKAYNDTYGHQAGDDCLRVVAEALARTINRPSDIVARFGGEEFAIVLGGTDAAGARQIAELAVDNINKLVLPHRASVTSPIVTVSVGVATKFATMDNGESDLIKAADDALYLAKANGRNRIVESRPLDLADVPLPLVLRDHMDAPAS